MNGYRNSANQSDYDRFGRYPGSGDQSSYNRRQDNYNHRIEQREQTSMNGYGPQSSATNGYGDYDHGYGWSGGDSPTYELDHLATFTVGKRQGLVPPEQGIERLRHMEMTTGIWAMRCQLIIEPNNIVIIDKQTGDEMERFPADQIVEPHSRMNHDRRDIYNNIILFTVVNNSGENEMHIFQCIGKPADEVIGKIQDAMEGRLGLTKIPPTPHPDRGGRVDYYDDDEDTRIAARAAQNYQPGPKVSQEFRKSLYNPNKKEKDAESVFSEKTDRDVMLLNHCFDDIERFVGHLQQAAEAFRELEKRRKSRHRGMGDGMLSVRARPPPAKEFIDVFQKFKLSFILLAKLKPHIHDPNAPELVHFLFTPLSLVIEASRDPRNGTPDLASKVVSPLLSSEARDLLLNCLTSKEMELWQSLGDAWLVSRDNWKGYVPPYFPRFSDGWQPSPAVLQDHLGPGWTMVDGPPPQQPPQQFTFYQPPPPEPYQQPPPQQYQQPPPPPPQQYQPPPQQYQPPPPQPYYQPPPPQAYPVPPPAPAPPAPEPPRARSPQPERARSPEPRRARSPSPERERLRSLSPRRRSPSPEPRRRRSPSPEPRRRRSPSPEPRRRRSRSPESRRRRSRSHERRHRLRRESYSPESRRSYSSDDYEEDYYRSRRRSSSYDRYEYQDSRDYSSRRDYERREYSPSRREYSPPRREYSPPRREYSPPRRELSPPRREHDPYRPSSPPPQMYPRQHEDDAQSLRSLKDPEFEPELPSQIRPIRYPSPPREQPRRDVYEYNYQERPPPPPPVIRDVFDKYAGFDRGRELSEHEGVEIAEEMPYITNVGDKKRQTKEEHRRDDRQAALEKEERQQRKQLENQIRERQLAQRSQSLSLAQQNGGQMGGLENLQTAFAVELRQAKKQLVEVTHDRDGKNSKELTVKKGEVLELLDDSRNWWKLRNYRGEVGHAPFTILSKKGSQTGVRGK